MANLKLIQFGAGNIGRGFLADLFHHAGYKIVFIEKDKDLVREINKKGKYTLEIAGPKKFQKYEIDNITAIDVTEVPKIKQEIANADLIAVSVGEAALPSVAKILARGLEARALRCACPIDIIIAENLLKADSVLYNLLDKEINKDAKEYLNKNVGLVRAVVSRMVPVLAPQVKKKDPLYIKAEEYRELPVDRNAFKGNIPVIEGIKPCDNFEAYEERKLFIHNTGHAMAAYLGFLKGHEYVYEAMRDSGIKEKVMAALKEISYALIKKYPFLKSGLNDHIEDLCRRFSNETLADTVARVGRDPLRKLKPHDRLVGACRIVEKYNGDPAPVTIGISACLLYVLSEICEIKKDEALYKLIKSSLLSFND